MNPFLDPPAWVGDPAHRFLTRVGSEPWVRGLRSVVWGLLVLGFLAFLVAGADRPADPRLTNQVLPGFNPPTTAVSHP